jgi:glycosyltransferase involved in cell wall biosynthesis
MRQTMAAESKAPSVLFVCQTPALRDDDSSYVERHIGVVVEALADRGSSLTMLLGNGTESPSHRAERLTHRVAAPIAVINELPAATDFVGNHKHLVHYLRVYRQVMRRRYDVVVVRGIIPAMFALYALARMQRCKIVHWYVGDQVAIATAARDGWKARGAALYFRLERLIDMFLLRAWNGVAVTNGSELLARLPRGPKRATISSSHRLRDIAHLEQRQHSSGSFRALVLCYLRPEKGVETLLSAFADGDLPDASSLTIAGSADDPTYSQRLQSLALELSIEHRISWWGFADEGDKSRLLMSHDVLCLPSLSEGTPRVLLEAMSYGLAVVATRVGGIPDVVTDGVSGRLVTPGDSRELCRTLEQLAHDPAERARLAKAGRELALQYTVERLAEDLLR